jgi:hypothetical protein
MTAIKQRTVSLASPQSREWICIYGNGGMSSWTRTFVNNMRTHENTDGSDKTNIEFCFDPLYWAMHDCYSTTLHQLTRPKQAWRAGFREGVKMCTRDGVSAVQQGKNF